jgi:hypothetical protein
MSGDGSRVSSLLDLTSLTRKHHTYPAVRTILVLVQRPHAQRADVAGDVPARRNRVVAEGVGANKAHLDVAIGALILGVVLDLEARGLAGRLLRLRLPGLGLGGLVWRALMVL